MMRTTASFALSLLIVALLFTGCNGEQQPTPEPILFESLGTGQSATFEADTTEVIVRSREEWEEIKDKMRPPQPFRDVDFDEDVVIVLARQASTGGYSVDVQRVDRIGEEIVVQYVLGVPEDECITTQGRTTPFRAVAFERVEDAEIRFESRRQTYRCVPRRGL